MLIIEEHGGNGSMNRLRNIPELHSGPALHQLIELIQCLKIMLYAKKCGRVAHVSHCREQDVSRERLTCSAKN
jgi:hypothetical protein